MLKIVEDSLRNRYKIIIILLCVIALTGLMYIDSIEHMENYDPTVAYQVGDEIIDTYVVDDKHYLFLPSWGIVNEYSCNSKSRIRKFGNRSSGTRKSPFLCLITYTFL